jgi:LuxR family transcriptional regulator, positive regulator of biofilm formation
MDLLSKGKKFGECDACRYRDHPVVIVGSNRFENDLLAHYIENQTPARFAVFENLSAVPPPTGTPAHQWRLVLLDCLGLRGSEILPLLKKEAAPYLQQDRVALINLKQEIEDTQEFISCGVRGLFFENYRADTLIKGICALKNGEMWISRAILVKYASQESIRPSLAALLSANLTRREREVLALLVTGCTNEEIAERLFISPHTVKSHTQNIFRKLGVKNRLQAAMWTIAN